MSHPFQEKTKDGTPYLEYREDDVQDSVFQAVLDLAYKMFKVKTGCAFSQSKYIPMSFVFYSTDFLWNTSYPGQVDWCYTVTGNKIK